LDRLTTADLTDLHEAVQRLTAELELIKARIRDYGRAQGGPTPSSLSRAETSLSRALEALESILERHPEVVSAMGAPDVRRYRKRTPPPGAEVRTVALPKQEPEGGSTS
jgi:hypothetical protein